MGDFYFDNMFSVLLLKFGFRRCLRHSTYIVPTSVCEGYMRYKFEPKLVQLSDTTQSRKKPRGGHVFLETATL